MNVLRYLRHKLNGLTGDLWAWFFAFIMGAATMAVLGFMAWAFGLCVRALGITPALVPVDHGTVFDTIVIGGTAALLFAFTLAGLATLPKVIRLIREDYRRYNDPRPKL